MTPRVIFFEDLTVQLQAAYLHWVSVTGRRDDASAFRDWLEENRLVTTRETEEQNG